MKTKIIGVLGLGIFGQTLAQELSNFEQDVIAIDSNPENVQAVAEVVTKAAIGDITDLASLKHIGISDCDTVIIATGNSLESSVLAVMHCKKLGVPQVIAKARNLVYEEVLYEIGADLVISPERESGQNVAANLMRNKITDVFQIESDISVIEFKIPKSWVGKTVEQLNIRHKFDLNLIGIRKAKNKPVDTEVPINSPLEEGIILVAIANSDAFQRYDYLGYFN
ncbi:TrkA family potassium uptake protein [Streptococcus agalactiae]|uniref:potassium channel family protein n=1 Tax=Streptococcus agalactiae TaxID=1311 RepID=UPI001292C52A|nr:TrkA family potassium uptake protein [Streptococcus agalactiae]MQP84441.1 TrkA family potassium uptake protein [Streptococcus agalactiae]